MIILACDHAGYELKEQIKAFFNKQNITTIDVGTYSKERVDYPDYARKVANYLQTNDNSCGVLICKSGIGMSIAANKYANVRAFLCYENEDLVRLAREHNNCNVICFGANFITKENVEKYLTIFLNTKFLYGHYSVRLTKLNT